MGSLVVESLGRTEATGPSRAAPFRAQGLTPATERFESFRLLSFRCLLVSVAYYLATKIAFVLCLPDSKVSLVFPPYALLITVLLFTPVRHWWALTLAAMCGHQFAARQSSWPLLYSLHCEVFDAVRIVAAAGGIRLFTKAPVKFATFREAFAVVASAAIVVPFVTAVWGAGFTVSNGYGTHYWIEWRNLWLSNAVTATALLPGFIIAVANAKQLQAKIDWKRVAEAAVLSAGLLASGIFVFAMQDAAADTSPELLYAPIPLLIWAALRFGPAGASASLLVVWVLAIWGAMHGRGPFLLHSPTQNTLSLQYFFLVISIPLTFLAVVTREAEHSEAEARESEARFRAVADSAPVMIWNTSEDKLCTFFNKSWLDFTGRTSEQELGNGWAEGVHPDDRDQCMHLYVSSFDARRDFTMEYRLRRSDGEYRWVLDTGVPRYDDRGIFQGYIGSCVDINGRKRAELEIQQHRSELAHLSRVTMLGELSGSLAHELNQPLTAILCNAQAAQRYLARESVDLDEVRAILNDIVEDDQRAGEVIRRLRLLLKKGQVNQQPLNANELIRDVLKLVHSDLMNHSVTVSTQLDHNLPTINVDRVQTQQVLLNLIMNACDAMSSVKASDRKLVVGTEVAEGENVRISVIDRGCGIAPGEGERIFEPFFTTKSHGLGLGLSVCRTIITAHGGTLSARNNPDRGACFDVTLPLYSEGQNQ